jgi:hypothetical protein
MGSEWDSITRANVEELLSALGPWLHRNWGVLIHEGDDPAGRRGPGGDAVRSVPRGGSAAW